MSPATRNARIVRQYLAGELQSSLAARYGVSQARISAIIRAAGQQGNWRARIGDSLHRHHVKRHGGAC